MMRCHRQGRARRNRRGIPAGAFGGERGQPRFFEHVQIVVRCRAIGADPHVDTELDHLRDRRDAGSKLQIAGRVVCDSGVCIAERPDFSLVHVHAVRSQDARIEQPLLFRPWDHGHAVFLARTFDLERRFGQMGVKRHVEFNRQLGTCAKDLRGAGVWRVRRNGRNDRRMPLPFRDEGARQGQPVFVARRIGRRELQDGLRAERTESGSCRRLGDRVFEVIHVGKAGGAGANHLGARQPGAERDEIGADELALDGHHVAHQPDIETQVVGQTPKQRHRRMRVRIHEPGHDHASAAGHGFRSLKVAGDVADGDDRAAADSHACRWVHRELLVHRDDERVSEEQIAGASHGA